MLFSSDTVANTINNAFEPVWESVRPVPLVTIDFGNGHSITRTLHGNIATYLCNAQGTVYDILPGIYEPVEYLKQLQQFSLLYRHAYQQVVSKDPLVALGSLQIPKLRSLTDLMLWRKALAEHVDQRLKAYHKKQAEFLKDNQAAGVLVIDINGGLGKRAIEAPIELIASGDAGKLGPFKGIVSTLPSHGTIPATAAEIAGWKELAEDTRINESVRRRAIHEKLAGAGRVKPGDVKKWLFKEVLAADLDDPTLGIGKLLDNRYPFAAEDTAARNGER